MLGTEAVWPGYGPDGNDRRGHMHPHPAGTFIRSDGVSGVYCSAPLDPDGACSDPPTAPPMPTSPEFLSYARLNERYPRLLACIRWQGILSPSEALSAIAAHRRGDGRWGGSEAVVHYGGATQLIQDAWRHRDAIRTVLGSRGHLLLRHGALLPADPPIPPL